MEPTLGFEPRTVRLQGGCSATELRRLVCQKGVPSPVSRFLRRCLQNTGGLAHFLSLEPATTVYRGFQGFAKCAGKCAG